MRIKGSKSNEFLHKVNACFCTLFGPNDFRQVKTDLTASQAEMVLAEWFLGESELELTVCYLSVHLSESII